MSAERSILKWCRAQGPGPVMRNGITGGLDKHEAACRVLNVNKSEAHPEARYPGHRRAVTYAEGDTWEECAAILGLEDC